MTKKLYDHMFNQWETEAKCPSEEDIPKEIQNHVKAVEDDYDNASRDEAEKMFKQLIGKAKLGKPPGEFVKDPAAQLRVHFFEAIWRVAPEAFSSLAQDVYPLYSAAYNKTRPRKINQVRKRKEETAFLISLRKWAAEWNLTPDWAQNRAMHILAEWRRKPDILGNKPKVIMVNDAPLKFPEEKTPELEDDPLGYVHGLLWDVWSLQQGIIECKTLREANRKARTAASLLESAAETTLRWENPWMETKEEFFERADWTLKKHITYRELMYEEEGWKKPVEKRNRSGNPAQHFEWLALYQLKQLTYKKIAIMYLDKQEKNFLDNQDKQSMNEYLDIKRKNVEKNVKKMAKLCDIMLRDKVNAGRPRKQ